MREANGIVFVLAARHMTFPHRRAHALCCADAGDSRYTTLHHAPDLFDMFLKSIFVPKKELRVLFPISRLAWPTGFVLFSFWFIPPTMLIEDFFIGSSVYFALLHEASRALPGRGDTLTAESAPVFVNSFCLLVPKMRWPSKGLTGEVNSTTGSVFSTEHVERAWDEQRRG